MLWKVASLEEQKQLQRQHVRQPLVPGGWLGSQGTAVGRNRQSHALPFGAWHLAM